MHGILAITLISAVSSLLLWHLPFLPTLFVFVLEVDLMLNLIPLRFRLVASCHVNAPFVLLFRSLLALHDTAPSQLVSPQSTISNTNFWFTESCSAICIFTPNFPSTIFFRDGVRPLEYMARNGSYRQVSRIFSLGCDSCSTDRSPCRACPTNILSLIKLATFVCTLSND
jgi:hypothetical protein